MTRLEPCTDAVSRQAILDGIEELKKSPWATDKRGNGFEYLITEALDVVKDLCIKQLPSVNPQPCDDAVSREAVDKYIVELLSGYLYAEERERLEKLNAYLWELPSVTQKSGKWIERQNIARTSIATAIEFRWTYECSECGHEVRHKTRFCASCGCRMESDGE